MREIAIGDIHGCVHTLRQMIEQISPVQDDRLIFLGDYVDRGFYSAQVIEELL
jgi:serine/threonine protein phosphatase 1